jgi:RNA polymerase sigma-70 factor (ECF subfamily)
MGAHRPSRESARRYGRDGWRRALSTSVSRYAACAMTHAPRSASQEPSAVLAADRTCAPSGLERRHRASPHSTRSSMATHSSHPRNAGDDRALVERLRRGDRAAFAALVERHSGSLLRVARALLRDLGAAEDVVQETWIALLTGLEGFEGRASLRTWLFRVLAFKARNRFHRDGRMIPFSALPQHEGGPPAIDPDELAADGGWTAVPGGWTETDPERLALGAETREAIEAAIRELPEMQRAVLTLRDVEGLETDEICNLLGVTVTNQRVLLHRARLRVRAALARRLGRRP